MGTKQIETATVIGSITSVAGGNATVIVTGAYIDNSPITLSVGVANLDTDALVAEKIRVALSRNAYISAQYATSGTGANVVLTDHTARSNDTTLNINVDNGTCTGLTAAPTSANTLAGSGISNGYADLSTFNARFFPNDITSDAVRDGIIENLITSVSRQIDNYCHRQFYKETATKYFSPEEPHVLFVDELQTITTIKTDEDLDGTFEVTMTTDDYRKMPLNAVADVTPTLWLKIKPNSSHWFPVEESTVEIAGEWGYCDIANVPYPVKEACYIQAERLYMRQSAPFGVVGSAEMGSLAVIPKFDPDVKMLLDSYVRLF